jgi:hypothetical protein
MCFSVEVFTLAREPRCALRSDDTDARKTDVARFGRSHEWR